MAVNGIGQNSGRRFGGETSACWKMGAIFGLILLLGGLAACDAGNETTRGPSPTEPSLSAPARAEKDHAASAQRVISLSPVLTETLCALGGCERLVAIDRFSNWPDEVNRLPRLGGRGSLSVEALLSHRPDLVLMMPDAALEQRLQKAGVAVLVLQPERLGDIPGMMQRVATALGIPVARADARWQEIERDLQKLAESLPARARGWRTYVEIDPAPYLAGPTSFMGELLTRLGLGNVVTDTGQPFVMMSREWVLQAQPDLLMISDPAAEGMAPIRARPGWSRLNAMREGRVCLLVGKALDTLVRPGPRLAEGARQIRDCVVSVLDDAPASSAQGQ